MSRAYYNEHDKFAAAWLRELIEAGLIADGDVDERDIQDVQAADLAGYTQCHFFAGIGGWSYALRLAGWPDARPVWTGSCPCQPYSAAGRGKGASDPRNLWPAWFRLIRESLPTVVIGEQAPTAIGHGWLDDVSTSLEAQGYAIGAFVLGAHSVQAPHIRQRLWFVAEHARPNTDGREANGRDQRDAVGWQRSKENHRRSLDAPRVLWATESRPPVLADGIPNRVERVCAFGNAIVPQVAAEFIGAYMDITQEPAA